MVSNLIDILKQALNRLIPKSATEKEYQSLQLNTISEDMRKALKLWKNMYMDCPPWEDAEAGVESMGYAKDACQSMATTLLNELNIRVVPPDFDTESQEEEDQETLAYYLQEGVKEHLVPKLSAEIEKALALGGCVIKPYLSNNRIYYDFVMQGDFYPIDFDDDGNITDIAFIDQFVDGKKIFTRIERQTFLFNDKKIQVINKAFKADYVANNKNAEQELGEEISLEEVDKWKDITDEFEIENIKKPLYGYYKVACANNVDLKSPLGASFFHPARRIIKKIDHQMCRYDWEFEGGQLAIDVDPTALEFQNNTSYFGHVVSTPQGRARIFRSIDLGEDKTYEPFNPSLRDSNYKDGLYTYLMMAEDKMGLSRGSLGGPTQTEAKTATEIKILKQRVYDTANKNQSALEKCFNDVIDATVALIDLYDGDEEIKLNVPKPKQNPNEENKEQSKAVDSEKKQEKEYQVLIDWGDSVLVDKDAEIAIKMQLCDKGILSKAEVRAAYTGEPLEVAAQQIQNIIDTNRQNMATDIFAQATGSNLPASANANQNQEEEEEDKDAEEDAKKKEEDKDAKK